MLRSFFDKRHAEYAIYRQKVTGVSDPVDSDKLNLFSYERTHGIKSLHVAWTN